MDIIQIIIQGGAVGLAAYIIYVGKVLITNHIEHNTVALQELRDAIKSLTEYLKEHHKK